MFLARLVLGFTVLAAATLTVIAISSGKDYVSVLVGVVMIIAAGVHYFWVRRNVRADLDKHQCEGSEQ